MKVGTIAFMRKRSMFALLLGSFVATVLQPIGVGAQEPLTCGGLQATIVGTEGFDRIYGTDGDDVIVSLGGRDVIRAGAGDDTICAGDGRDKVFGGAGNDTIYGEKANDRLIGQQGDDTIFGGPGRDYLKGSTGNDTVNGGGGNDQLIDGGPGLDWVEGGRGVDRCEFFDPTMRNWATPEMTYSLLGAPVCGELDVLGRPILSSVRYQDSQSLLVDFTGYVTKCMLDPVVEGWILAEGVVMWTGEPLEQASIQISVGTFENERWQEVANQNAVIGALVPGQPKTFSIGFIRDPGVPFDNCTIFGFGG